MTASSPPTSTVSSSWATIFVNTGGRRRDLGVDLVGGHLEQGSSTSTVALLLEPAGDGAFGNALTERGHLYGHGHFV
jgi:hypothetical protein